LWQIKISPHPRPVKKALIVLLTSFVLASVGFYVLDESKPPSKPSVINFDGVEQADALANKLLHAINKPAWDTIRYVQWTHRGTRHSVWDRKNNVAQIKWRSYRALIDINSAGGVVYEGDILLTGTESEEQIAKAIKIFNNDSFWLNAPAKVFDPGTERSIVDHQGKDALMVTYTYGGSTPGDSYLWILDDDGLPTAFKMWVSIIPIGGMEFSWEGWKEFDGTMISQMHKSSLLNLPLTNIKTGNSLSEIGLEEELFSELKD